MTACTDADRVPDGTCITLHKTLSRRQSDHAVVLVHEERRGRMYYRVRLTGQPHGQGKKEFSVHRGDFDIAKAE